MTYNISIAAHRTIISAFAALVLASLPQAGLAASPSDTGVWTINLKKSKLGPGTNTLVLEPAGQSTQATSAGGTFLVISDGKVYLATDAAVAATPSNGVKPAGYTAWKGMKLEEIGDHVRSIDICAFRCQQGLRDNRPMTLTFAGKGIDPSGRMNRNVLVFDGR